MQVTPEEAYPLQALKERRKKFNGSHGADFFVSGFIDGFNAYKEFLESERTE